MLLRDAHALRELALDLLLAAVQLLEGFTGAARQLPLLPVHRAGLLLVMRRRSWLLWLPCISKGRLSWPVMHPIAS